MGMTVVKYKVSEGRGDENQLLVEAVFAELAASEPEGLRYGTIRLEDGVTFIHVADVEGDNPLATSEAFSAFQADLLERCDQPPALTGGTVIGNYGLSTD